MTFSRVVGDLHLGDHSVTWKKLVYVFFGGGWHFLGSEITW